MVVLLALPAVAKPAPVVVVVTEAAVDMAAPADHHLAAAVAGVAPILIVANAHPLAAVTGVVLSLPKAELNAVLATESHALPMAPAPRM